MATPTGVPIFDEAMEKMFTNWTLLSIAVDGGWGGRESRAKRVQIFADVLERLQEGSKKRRPPSFENEDDVQDLADFLWERLVAYFHVEAQDNSEDQIAFFCLKLYNTCQTGDLSFAQTFLQEIVNVAPVDIANCKGVEDIQYATEEDQLVAALGGADLDGAGSSDDDMSDDDKEKPPEPTIAAPFLAATAQGCTGLFLQSQPMEAPVARVKEEPIVDDDGFTMVPTKRR